MNGLELQDILLTFPEGGRRRTVLDIPYLKVTSGEHIGIRGASGSGKSSLLNVVSGLVLPDRGTVRWGATVPGALPEHERDRWRGQHIGFVFQDFNLLDTFSLKDNIFLPLVLAGLPVAEMERRIAPIAKRLQIDALLEKYPYEVSGGQKQRVAVARALITNPKLILADEPTGALDSKSTDSLLQVFSEINQTGQTILMVTHSTKAASHAGRVLFIKDGTLFHQLYRGTCSNEQLYQKISDTLTILATGGNAQ